MTIYPFGSAPGVKALGYMMRGTLVCSIEDLKAAYNSTEFVFVEGPASTRPNCHEYARFMPNKNKPIPFHALPVGAEFIDGEGDHGKKVDDRNARMPYCAPGFLAGFRLAELVTAVR